MVSCLNHLQVNVDPKNFGFYKDLMAFLGWRTLSDSESVVGFGSGTNGSLWFQKGLKDLATDYDGTGVNHIGISVDSPAAVDLTADYLKKRDIILLFDTPRKRPEFSDAGELYYQIMFESPDKILFEIVYTGPEQKLNGT